jgi:AhpD family alkylhydroperoxidase
MNCWPSDFAPDITTGVQHLFKAVYAGGVPSQTLELVHLRASQINGCSACVNAGAANATKAGVSPEKLLTLAAWYEDPRFDDAERAALALTEAATRLADRPGAVTDEIWPRPRGTTTSGSSGLWC